MTRKIIARGYWSVYGYIPPLYETKIKKKVKASRSKKFADWLERRKKIFRNNATTACNISRLSTTKKHRRVVKV